MTSAEAEAQALIALSKYLLDICFQDAERDAAMARRVAPHYWVGNEGMATGGNVPNPEDDPPGSAYQFLLALTKSPDPVNHDDAS